MKQPPKTWKLRGFLVRAHVLVLAFQDEDSSVSAYFQPYKPFVPAKTEPEAEQDSGQQVVWLFFLTLRFTFCDYAAAAAAMAGIMIVAGEQGLLGSGRKISGKNVPSELRLGLAEDQSLRNACLAVSWKEDLKSHGKRGNDANTWRNLIRFFGVLRFIRRQELLGFASGVEWCHRV